MCEPCTTPEAYIPRLMRLMPSEYHPLAPLNHIENMVYRSGTGYCAPPGLGSPWLEPAQVPFELTRSANGANTHVTRGKQNWESEEPMYILTLGRPANCTPHCEDAVSKGSVGHPFKCGMACESTQNESGCCDGSDCKCCHFCEWTKVGHPLSVGVLLEVVMSQGSVGHPFKCAEVCKFARKPRGCKDGSACLRCHQCEWNSRRELSRPCPSEIAVGKGSVGHPFECADFCKYAKKARGCKDGSECDHCHLCTTTRIAS